MTDLIQGHDRPALLAHLRGLADARALTDADRELLRFCFRASDHDIYFAAAATLGRQLPEEPALQEWLQRYGSTRGVEPRGLVPLEGERSHRRILLARCAATVAAPADWPAPIDLQQPELPERVQDVSALLQGLLILHEAKDSVAGLADYLATLLERCHPFLYHPGVAGRWSSLMLLSGAAAEALTQAVLERLELAGTGTVATRLTELRAADAIVRSVATRHTRPAEFIASFPHPDHRVWVTHRLQDWTGTPLLADLLDTPGAWFLGVLRQAYSQRAAETGLGMSASAAAERLVLLNLSPLLQQPDRWLALAEGERALALFWLLERLDQAEPLPVPAADLLPASAQQQSTTQRTDTLLQVLDMLADRERLALANLFEVRKLHALASPWVALRLLPPREALEADPELAEALADVLEQQLRTALTSNAEFDVAHYLQLALIRRPHPAIATALLRLIAQRTYQDTQGQEVDVQQQLRQWKQALQAPVQAGQPWQALQAPLQSPDSLPSLRCSQLVDWIGADRHPAAADSVAARLQQLHEAQPQTLGRQAPGPRVQVLLEQLQQRGQNLLRKCERMELLAQQQPDAARSLAGELQLDVAALRLELEQWLPEPDAWVLGSTCLPVLESLQAWQEGLELCQQWHHGRTRTIPDARFPESLLPALLHAVESGQLRGDCHSALTLGLNWQQELDTGLASAWQQVLVARWIQALRLALGDQSLSRVEALLLEERYKTLATDPAAHDVLEDAKRFCFDALHLGSARRAAKLVGNQSPLRGLGSFFLHYSAVWIGLLVGAILMLDFGDPWKAMAEEEDLFGIGLTGLLGLGGTWAYLLFSQRSRQLAEIGTQPTLQWLELLGRTFAFLMLCTVFTLIATGGLWLLLSGTDEVVHGPMAWGHIVVWTGFTLLIGTFMGLIAKAA